MEDLGDERAPEGAKAPALVGEGLNGRVDHRNGEAVERVILSRGRSPESTPKGRRSQGSLTGTILGRALD